MIRVADYAINRMAEAVDRVFCVPGGGAAFLDDAVRVSGSMKAVCCHHEQAAAISAESYARVRGMGLVIVTSGPGVTNAMTGIASAFQDSIPLIAISGQVFSTQTVGTRAPGLRSLGVQEIDAVSLVRSVTKYATMVADPQTIRYHLERALHEARSGRPGPAWLDLPADVQNARVDPDALPGFEPGPVYKDNLSSPIRSVVERLRRAKRPLLHVGQGVRIAGAVESLLELLRASGMPVITARNGADMISYDHPCYVGRAGTFSQRGANFAVQSCDLYIAVGTRLSLAQTGYSALDYARRASVVMVDVDRAELEKETVNVDLKVQADAGEFIRALLAGMGLYWPDRSEWLARCKVLQAKYPPVTEDQRARTEGTLVNSYGFLDLLTDLAEPGDVIVTDVGFAYQNAYQVWRVKPGQRLLSSNSLAPMGWGLPAAVGAAAAGAKRVICLTGDGGLMFNLQELATVAHHKMPVKVFIFNNGGYLTMKQSQDLAFGGRMGSDAADLSFPDFQTIALANRIDFLRCPDRLCMDGIVKAALAHDDPVICELMMDPEQPQIPKSINRRLPDGTIKQTAIEDAWPFLDPAEVAENLHV